MKILLIAILFMFGCSEKVTPNPLYTEEGVKFWTAYSDRMQGRCLRRWDGQEAVISKDQFNKDPAWVAICSLNRVCDFEKRSRCVTSKVCSTFERGSYLYDHLQNNHYTEIKCKNGLSEAK